MPQRKLQRGRGERYVEFGTDFFHRTYAREGRLIGRLVVVGCTRNRTGRENPGIEGRSGQNRDIAPLAQWEEIVAGGRGAQTWAHAVDGLRAALTSSGVPADVLARAEERRADLTRAVDGLTDLLGWADAARA